MKRFIAIVLALTMVLCLFAACDQTPAGTTAGNQTPSNGTTNAPTEPGPTDPKPTEPAPTEPAPSNPVTEYEPITIAEALAIAEAAGTTATEQKYYISGTVTQVQNDMWGNMIISDDTGSILIYGTYSADGSTRYDAMESKPDVGDKVLVYGVLMTYNNTTPQIKDAWLIQYEEGTMETPDDPVVPPVDWSEYNIITIAEALAICETAGGTATTEKYYIRGVIVSIDNEKYGNLTIKDDTGSIYIYGTNSADGSVPFGNMTDKPSVGDEVLLYGSLMTYTNYGGSKAEMTDAWLIGYGAAPKKEMPAYDSTLTVGELIALPWTSEDATPGRYYVTATIDSVSNATYGAMYISDETGSIYVYNSMNADGTVGYASMAEKPYKGDVVTLYVTVHYFGEMEIKSAYIISWEAGENDYSEANYPTMSIADARDAAEDTKMTVTGVVARITYANGMIPSGVILVDGTSSIYVYDGDLAARVAIGNTITIGASKTYWVLDKEQSSAGKFGYKGCNQLENAYLVSNDEGNSAYDTSWITETTIKDIMDTPVSEDITSKIFKVTALVTRADGNGFVNYYLNDLDGTTGSYIYTQCNGNDFDWVNAYNGKICTVYMVVLNAKSSAAGCIWRFLPISIVDESFDVSSVNIPEHIVKYYGVGQFETEYTSDPALELITSVDSALLNFAGATLSYDSDNTAIVYFENGVMYCGEYGTANITITGSYNGAEYSQSLTITVKEPAKIDYIDVKTAIETAPGTDEAPVIVTVKGIVGPSLVNQIGFYLIDDTGIIAVLVQDTTVFEGLEMGQEVILTGERFHKTKGGDTYFGQTCLQNATIVVNNYGAHDYCTDFFVKDFTTAEFYNLDATVDYSTTVFVVKATYSAQGYSVKLTGADGSSISLYCSGSGQYSWLNDYAGQELTFEVAGCNWNSKTYWRGCILSVTLADGTKILNPLNFNNY